MMPDYYSIQIENIINEIITCIKSDSKFNFFELHSFYTNESNEFNYKILRQYTVNYTKSYFKSIHIDQTVDDLIHYFQQFIVQWKICVQIIGCIQKIAIKLDYFDNINIYDILYDELKNELFNEQVNQLLIETIMKYRNHFILYCIRDIFINDKSFYENYFVSNILLELESKLNKECKEMIFSNLIDYTDFFIKRFEQELKRIEFFIISKNKIFNIFTNICFKDIFCKDNISKLLNDAFITKKYSLIQWIYDLSFYTSNYTMLLSIFKEYFKEQIILKTNIKKIVKLSKKIQSFVRKYFNNDINVIELINESIIEYLNENTENETIYEICKYIDSILSNDDNDNIYDFIEIILHNILSKKSLSKQKFIDNYKKRLFDRILTNKLKNIDFEKLIGSFLKNDDSEVEQLLYDYQFSKELIEKEKKYKFDLITKLKKSNKNECDEQVSIYIFGKNNLIYNENNNILHNINDIIFKQFPNDCKTSFLNFQKRFLNINNGKKLINCFQHSLIYGRLLMYNGNHIKEMKLTLNFYQTFLLLLLELSIKNDWTISLKTIYTILNIDHNEHLKLFINKILIDFPLIEVFDDLLFYNKKYVMENNKYTDNTDIKKCLKHLSVESKKPLLEVKYKIEGILIKTLKKNVLLDEKTWISNLNYDQNLILQCIESLIERNYVERIENKKYKYLP